MWYFYFCYKVIHLQSYSLILLISSDGWPCTFIWLRNVVLPPPPVPRSRTLCVFFLALLSRLFNSLIWLLASVCQSCFLGLPRHHWNKGRDGYMECLRCSWSPRVKTNSSKMAKSLGKVEGLKVPGPDGTLEQSQKRYMVSGSPCPRCLLFS